MKQQIAITIHIKKLFFQRKFTYLRIRDNFTQRQIAIIHAIYWNILELLLLEYIIGFALKINFNL